MFGIGSKKRCTVLIDDAVHGVRQEQWIVGQEIDRARYNQFKDENGNLYLMIHYENGEAQKHLVTKSMYLQLKAHLDTVAPRR